MPILQNLLGDGSSTALSIYEYIADDDDILNAYITLGSIL
jgi:hypothetical protein